MHWYRKSGLSRSISIVTLICFLHSQILFANPDSLTASNQSLPTKPIPGPSPEPTLPAPASLDGLKRSSTAFTTGEDFFTPSPLSAVEASEPQVSQGEQIFYNAEGGIDRYQFSDRSSIQYVSSEPFSIRILSPENDSLEEITVPKPPDLDLSRAVRLTLENGLEAYSIDGELVEFRTSTGIHITNFVLNDQNDIVDALLIYPDQTKEIIRHKVLIRRISPGIIEDFLPDGRVVREIQSEGISWYGYVDGKDGKVTETRVFGPDGSKVTYDVLGMLHEVDEPGKRYFVYDRWSFRDWHRLVLDEKQSFGFDPKTPKWLVIGDDGQILRMRLWDGTFVRFKNGQVARVRDKTGKEISDYAPVLEDGFLKRLVVSRGDDQLQYNGQGFLDKITTPGGTVHRVAEDTDQDGQITDEEIQLIFELPDGSTLLPLPDMIDTPMIDPDGKILNGILKTKEGIKQRIVSGMMTGYETVDGRFYEVDGNEFKLSRWVFGSEQGQAVVQYNTDAEIVSLQEILFPERYRLYGIQQAKTGTISAYVEESLNPSEDGWKERHFREGRLVKLVTTIGAEISYDATGLAKEVKLKEGEKTVDYEILYLRSPEGKLEGITFNNPSSSYSFNHDGELLKLLSHGFYAELEQGSVKRLLNRFAEVNSPEWSQDGKLNGEVEFHDGVTQVIRDSELIQSIRPSSAKVNYTEGLIDSVEIKGALYDLVYEENGRNLQAVKVGIQTDQGYKEFPFIPFLLEPETYWPPALEAINADQPEVTVISELRQILLGRPLQNAFPNRFEIESEFVTGETLFLAHLVPDPDRGDVYQISGDYYPQWENVSLRQSDVDQGFIGRGVEMGNGGFAEMTSSLTDMNGDGLLDRVFIERGRGYWWVQFGNGQGFEDAVPWLGVWRETEASGSLRFFDSANPYVFGDLVDMNGDNRPDRVFKKPGNEPVWYVQLNTGYGFYAPVAWDTRIDFVTNGQDSAKYALRVWDDTQGTNQPLIADLVDLDGDGLPDRVFRPPAAPYSRWFWQKNLGNGFDGTLIWEGVDTGFHSDAQKAASLSWYESISNNKEHPLTRPLTDWAQNHTRFLQLFDLWPGGDEEFWSLDEDAEPMGQLRLNFSEPEMVQIAQGMVNALIHAVLKRKYPSLVFNDARGEPVHFFDPSIYPVQGLAPSDIDDLMLRRLEELGDEHLDEIHRDDFIALFVTEAKTSLEAILKPHPELSYLKDRIPFNEAGLVDVWNWVKEIRIAPVTENIVRALNELVAGVSDLVDINGDGLLDRMVLKEANLPGGEKVFEWYVQFNHGDGFEPAQLWDAAVRMLPESPNELAATSLLLIRGSEGSRDILMDLVDVTGDGLPDRVSVDRNDYEFQAQSSWWVEVNTGKACADAPDGEPCGFLAPERWDGIYGTTGKETAISQDHEIYKAGNSGEQSQTVDLRDMNADGIPDRVIFRETEGKWLVQIGTGHGFLPVEEFQIKGLKAPATAFNASRYNYLHASLKVKGNDVPPGEVEVKLLDEGGQVTQSWVVGGLSTDWQDFYLAVDQTKAGAAAIKIESIQPSGGSVPEILAEDMTFVSLRPPATKDWLDRMLTEEDILSEIHSERTKTLQDMLGFKDAQGPMDFNWQKLLEAPSVIHFDPETKEINEFRTLYGSKAEVKDGVVTKTELPDHTVIVFEKRPVNPNQTTQTVILPDSQGTQSVDLEYGRIRSVAKPGENPLQYSYEFCSQGHPAPYCGGLEDGTEVTVVKDTVTGKIERNINGRLIQRQEPNGVVTDYEYNEDGELIRSVISYKGKILHTFEHGLTGEGNRIIKTQEGVVEEYSPEGQILFHTTPEGYRYAHSFGRSRAVETSESTETITLPDGSKISVTIPTVSLEENPEGEEIHEVTLAGYESSAESVEYGEIELVSEDREARKVLGLTSVALSDEAAGQKTILNFSRIQELEETDEETGQVTRSLRPLDAIVTHPDGTVTEFKDGKPYLVKTASGREVLIRPDPGTDLLINPAESAQFHFNEARAFWDSTVLPNWEKFQAPPTLPIRMEYTKEEGKLVTREFAEGVVELYNDSGKIHEVLGRDGERLIHYSYDADGNPIRIDMEGARRRLESSVLKVQAELAVERFEALERVEERKQVLDQQIEAQYLEAKRKLLALLAQIHAAREQLANVPARGKKMKNMIRDAQLEIDNAESQVNEALVDLERQYREALAKVDDEVKKANASIETQTKDISDQITLESQNAQGAILLQEISPIVSHWYRKLLGQDPNQKQYGAVLAKADYKTGTFDLEGLKKELLEGTERMARQSKIRLIKAAVANYLRASVDGENSQASPEVIEFIDSLGIEPKHRIQLTIEEVNAIIKHLNEKAESLHFGQSAYLALEALLKAEGIEFNRTELATRLILTDILTGTITPIEQGDLVISLYALRKVGEHYKLKASNYKMTYEVLRAMYESECGLKLEGCKLRVVAHINGNHYVILTGIEIRPKTERRPKQGEDGTFIRDQDGKIIFEEVALLDKDGNALTEELIRYIDPGAGPEDALSEVTLSKEEFLRTWIDPRRPDDGFGYVLSARPPPEAVSGQYSLLSVPEERSIRGAFFAFLIAIFIAVIKAVVDVVIAVVVAVKALVVALVNGLVEIFQGFAGFFKELFTGNFLGAFKAGFGSLWEGLGIIGNGFQAAFGSIHGALLAGIQGIAETIPLFGPVLSTLTQTSAFANLLKLSLIGLTLDGAGKLLEKLSLSPKFIQTIFAGGKILIGIGMLATGNPMVIMTAIGLTGSGVTEILSLHTKLSPVVASVIGIGFSALSAFAAGYFDPKLTGIEVLKKAAPFLAADLAGVGLSALGNHLGLDPRLMALINIPVRATVQGLTTGLVNPNGGGGPGAIFKAIEDSLFSRDTLAGFVSVGASILEDVTGIPAIVTTAGFAGLTGGIQSVLRKQGFFKGVAQAYQESVLELLGLSASREDPTDPNFKLRQQARLARVINFASVVQQNGITKALETYAASIFSRKGVEAIFERGGIADFISDSAQAVKISNRDLIEIKVGSQDFIYLDPSTEDIEMIRKGNTLVYGEFGVDENGNFGLKNGYHEQRISDDRIIRLDIQDGLLTEVHIDVGGTRQFTAYPLLKGGTLQINPDGTPQNGLLWDHQGGVLYVVRDGVIIHYAVEVLKSPLSQPSFDDILQSMVEEANRKGVPLSQYKILEAGSKQMYTGGKYIPSTKVIGFEGTVTSVTPRGQKIEVTTREGMHVLDGKSIDFIGNNETMGKVSVSSGVTYNAATPSVSGDLQLSAGIQTRGSVFGSGKAYLSVKGKVEEVSQIKPSGIAEAAGEIGIQTEARIDFLRTKVQSFYKFGTDGEPSVVFRTQTINEITGALSERELAVSFKERDSLKSYVPSVSANLMLLGDILNGERSLLTEQEREGLSAFISGELRATGAAFDQSTVDRLSNDFLSILPDMAQEAKAEMPVLLIRAGIMPDIQEIAMDSTLSEQDIERMQDWLEENMTSLIENQR
ncbi:MAG: hypothetical protein A3G87_02320 [Omnitrophica bacterium RIFCSPLOWO2_12_FULL_50_11]|nr:MAG: hypothetical protein A3G87_02320 [Omnitrophica bacterium RIFCSPLOWO2_12_FULL_50_11]